MRKILSYIKSHIYDIHAIMVGVVLVVLILVIREPLKRMIEASVNSRLAGYPEQQAKRKSLLRKWNILLLFLLMVLSVMGFALLALLSPFVDFSLQSGIMAGVYALCGSAFLEQVL